MAYQWQIPYVIEHADFDARFTAWTATPHAEGVAATLEWFRRTWRAHPERVVAPP